MCTPKCAPFAFIEGIFFCNRPPTPPFSFVLVVIGKSTPLPNRKIGEPIRNVKPADLTQNQLKLSIN